MISQYNKYKPSGIEWLGNIPEHWVVKRVKDIISEPLRYGANESADLYDENLPRYIRITDFGKDGRLRSDTFRSISEEIANDYLLKDGDLLFARSGATVGKTFQFKDYKGKSCFAGYLIKASPKEVSCTSDFLYFVTKSNVYESWKNSIFIQATIQNISAEKYSIFKFMLPPIEEQTTITNYLDKKTAKIDQLINNKKAQIERLKEIRQIEINNAVTKGLNSNVKLKPSGIEWLGDIPDHWRIKRLKEISSIWGRIGFRGYNKEDIVLDSNEGALTLGAKHIDKSNKIKLEDPEYLSWDKYYESPEIMVKLGDLLIVQRGSIGKFAIIEEEIGKATINPSMILINKIQVVPKFLFYVLSSNHIQSFIELLTSSTAVPMISQFQAGIFRIPFPKSKLEQIAIVDYLNERTNKIDKLINNVEWQINQLNEIRKIEIYNAVTGKIKVA